MTDVAAAVAAGDLSFLDESTLCEFIRRQRWFASKSREVAHLSVVDAVPLPSEHPLVVAALIEARFNRGTHELYQLPLGLRPSSDGWTEGVIADVDGWTVYDALVDPDAARELVELMRAEASIERPSARTDFHVAAGSSSGGGGAARALRPIGVEQSNSSIVFDDELLLKIYRRLEPGINPELEILSFLGARSFPHAAALIGWYEYSGRLMDATLALLQEFLPGARDGWELALEDLAVDPGRFISRAGELGEVTAELHNALASDSIDPAFAPKDLSHESLALITATVDEQIEQIFGELPEDDVLEPIRRRSEDVRQRLRSLPPSGRAGRVIRHHGDYHLGQALLTDRGWVIIDFEGEPARAISDRRRKRSPLRDVAGMLRSFAYAASNSALLHDLPAPLDWEMSARGAFLDAYLGSIDASLLPPGRQATEHLLAVFELEKAVYELRYELNNRPDWVKIPVAGIVRLLEEPAAA